MSEELLQKIRDGLGPKVANLAVKNPRRVYIDVAGEDLLDVVRYLFDDLQGRFAISTGMDTGRDFEVLHHFAFDDDHVVVTVRVRADAEDPSVDSITPIIKGAEFIEREMYDLLGIQFRGHPNPTRLILPDDWPEGVHPLRRGERWDNKARIEK